MDQKTHQRVIVVYCIACMFPQPAPAPNKPSQPSQGGSDFGDSSGPIFSMHSKAAEDEDYKMADCPQKDAERGYIDQKPVYSPPRPLPSYLS